MWDQRGRKRATKIVSPESQGKPDPTIEERIINSNEFVLDRGRGVLVDKAKAYYLYERSLSLANSEVEIAQPAIRIANIIMEDDCESYGVERDFLRALALYQQAEIGLRIDIADGQMYYIKRLREAVDGQQRVRALLSPRHC